MTGFLDIGGQSAGGGYQIPRSLRLRSSASAYLSRTFGASATSRNIYTFSGWVKRGTIGVQQYLMTAGNGTTDYDLIRFNGTDNFELATVNTSALTCSKISSSVYRDPSAWYHVVVQVNRPALSAKLYVNGVEVTYGTNTQPTNVNGVFNSNIVHDIGDASWNHTSIFDGYLSQVHFIDGQALTPASFGEISATTGQWSAKAYTGTYGTNGFYLPFSDTTSTTTLCADASGNGNNWTPNNISLTAGATYDSMTDVPLGGGGALGNGQGNYAVLNPLDSRGTNTVSAGNLTYVTGTTFGLNRGTIAMTSGKWYWEVTSFSGIPGVGVSRTDVAVTSAGHDSANGWAYFGDTGNKWTNNSGSAYGATFGTSDVIGVALDMDAGTLTFYKNNTSQGVAFSTGLSGQSLAPMLTSGSGASGGSFNFGQRPFAHTPPTGFKALHTGNLPAPLITKPNLHFDVVTRTGTGASYTKTGIQFQPDLFWGKSRNNAYSHLFTDSVRGVGKWLQSDTTSAEATDATGITSFNSDGYSIGTQLGFNGSGSTMVDWLWKAGGAPVTNTAGSITSQVSANTLAGISIITYTGTGANATVGHGLGVAPKMVIVKQRNPGAGTSWGVYHASLGATNYIILNTTAAQVTNTMWNNTAPTSSVFSLGGSGFGVNDSTINAVAYAFAEIPGFSKIGSYIGNGSADGPMVVCGFRPRWVMVKNISIGTEGWRIWDSARQDYNVQGPMVEANSSAAEATGPMLDFTATGFKIRNTSSPYNGSGNTMIFLAFAESPFQYALAR